MFIFSFFFSSRRRHTRYWRDWSSDVCSSDLKPTKETSEEEYFVTICLSGNGTPQIKSSASLRLYKDHIVGGALTRFLECISQTTTQIPDSHRTALTITYSRSKKRFDFSC